MKVGTLYVVVRLAGDGEWPTIPVGVAHDRAEARRLARFDAGHGAELGMVWDYDPFAGCTRGCVLPNQNIDRPDYVIHHGVEHHV